MKNYKNSKIMNTQIFHLIKYDLKDHIRSLLFFKIKLLLDIFFI